MPDLTRAQQGIPNGVDSSEKGGDDEIHRLEAEIATKRQRVIDSLGELRRRVQGATNWRQWIQEHPMIWIGAGLMAGILVGYRGNNNKRRQ